MEKIYIIIIVALFIILAFVALYIFSPAMTSLMGYIGELAGELGTIETK